MTTRFYQHVPKDLEANLRFRLDLRRRALHDEQFRRQMMTACRRDVLFFFNSVCWLYEPRVVRGRKLPSVIPFITWPHQDPVILAINEHLGVEDIGAEKSRGEGASWISVLLALRDWLFEPMSAVGLVSRTEDAVDNPEDPDSLMWKVDWELTKLPRWMAGVKDKDFKRNRGDHVLKNLRNGSTITGYSATGDVASGGRKRWFLMDELSKFPRGPDKEAMASTQHVTNSRLVVSTPKGSEGAYYELMHNPSSMVKVVLDWKDNQTRNRGLYTFQDGLPVAVDSSNPLPEHYNPPTSEVLDLFSRLRSRGFKLEGTVRSPWYDHECDRPGATPQSIAQELDRDYGGSMFRIFGADFFEKADARVAQPLVVGTLSYHPETLAPDFDEVKGGQLLLWCPLDVNRRPPNRQYAIGVDVSTGLGGSYTSNSAAVVFDALTMEQVGEFASNTVAPQDFADMCVAMAKMFHNAYLIWEHNGPGAGFTKRIIDTKYTNIHYRQVYWKQGRKRTREPGWWTDPRTKEAMFGELARSVKTGELTLRSAAMIKECGQYVRLNGKITHVQQASTDDDSSKGEAHGDRVIAACVALQGLRDRPLMGLRERKKNEIPPFCMAARQKAYEDSLRVENLEWDDRTTRDLMRR